LNHQFYLLGFNQLPRRKRTEYERPNALGLEGIAASGGEYHPKILRLPARCALAGGRSGSLPAGRQEFD